jgi:hypothetical protein
MGIMPFGSILAGSVAERIGVQYTLLLGAACCITGALIFALKVPMLFELLRPVFARMGICETEQPKSEP